MRPTTILRREDVGDTACDGRLQNALPDVHLRGRQPDADCARFEQLLWRQRRQLVLVDERHAQWVRQVLLAMLHTDNPIDIRRGLILLVGGLAVREFLLVELLLRHLLTRHAHGEPDRQRCIVLPVHLDGDGAFGPILQQVIQIAPDDAMLKISPDGLAFVCDRPINEPLVVIPEEVGVDCLYFSFET